MSKRIRASDQGVSDELKEYIRTADIKMRPCDDEAYLDLVFKYTKEENSEFAGFESGTRGLYHEMQNRAPPKKDDAPYDLSNDDSSVVYMIEMVHPPEKAEFRTEMQNAFGSLTWLPVLFVGGVDPFGLTFVLDLWVWERLRGCAIGGKIVTKLFKPSYVNLYFDDDAAAFWRHYKIPNYATWCKRPENKDRYVDQDADEE